MANTSVSCEKNYDKQIAAFLVVGIALGIIFRFIGINKNIFFYYDEGLWLNAHRHFLHQVQMNPPTNIRQFLIITKYMALLSLGTGKALWAFIADLRVFFLHDNSWYFVRIVSALFGTLTLGIVFLFSKRFYRSTLLGILSAALLALLPSHIFYSRTGLQESFSTFCFLTGMYFFVFSQRSKWKIIVSSLLFGCVFFSNYRMIIIPFIVGVCEIYIALSEGRKIRYAEYFLNVFLFFVLVLSIGSIKAGQYTNLYITFGWMGQQAKSAEGHFSLLNFFSYPYYLFSLESFFFAFFFFANIYFILKKKWLRAFPFSLVVVLMILFSFPQEKGVRYLCAVMPFMAMAASTAIFYLFKENSSKSFKRLLMGFCVLMVAQQIYQDYQVVRLRTAYEQSIKDILSQDPGAKVLSSQSLIQKLYVRSADNVTELKKGLPFLIESYREGYRYLIVDPQAYVYLTESGNRFTVKLADYLEFILKYVPPDGIYKHFESLLLKRFVLEHNEDLSTSLKFLRESRRDNFGALKVYSIQKILVYLKNVVEHRNGDG